MGNRYGIFLAATVVVAGMIPGGVSAVTIDENNRASSAASKDLDILTQKQIQAKLTTMPGNIMNHRNELRKLGLEVVSNPVNDRSHARHDAGSGRDHSSKRAIRIKRPVLIKQKGRHGKEWYIFARYRWRAKKAQWHYFDAGRSCNPNRKCKVGGKDGFGFRTSRRVNNRKVIGMFCGRPKPGRDWSNFGCFWTKAPDENSSQGATFRPQDKVYKTVVKPDSNVYTGSISMRIRKPKCGKRVNVFSRYAHGWSDTSLTGFSVSLSGFGLSWNKSEDHWQRTSQAGSFKRKCK